MIKIAFCFAKESILHYVQQEITKGFSRRGILIHALPATHPDDLLSYANQGILPDMILFSHEVYANKLLNTFLFLKEQKHSIIFILTKYSDSINISIEEDYHFLLHPFYEASLFSQHESQRELWNCVCKAYDLISSDKNTFAYYHRPIYHSTPLNHILYFASEGRCIRMITRSGSDSFYGRLDDLKDILDMKNCHFIRIHQSYLVNIRYISSYDRKTVILSTGIMLPISKCEYYHMLRKKVSIYSSRLTQKKVISL